MNRTTIKFYFCGITAHLTLANVLLHLRRVKRLHWTVAGDRNINDRNIAQQNTVAEVGGLGRGRDGGSKPSKRKNKRAHGHAAVRLVQAEVSRRAKKGAVAASWFVAA